LDGVVVARRAIRRRRGHRTDAPNLACTHGRGLPPAVPTGAPRAHAGHCPAARLVDRRRAGRPGDGGARAAGRPRPGATAGRSQRRRTFASGAR